MNRCLSPSSHKIKDAISSLCRETPLRTACIRSSRGTSEQWMFPTWTPVSTVGGEQKERGRNWRAEFHCTFLFDFLVSARSFLDYLFILPVSSWFLPSSFGRSLLPIALGIRDFEYTFPLSRCRPWLIAYRGGRYILGPGIAPNFVGAPIHTGSSSSPGWSIIFPCEPR